MPPWGPPSALGFFLSRSAGPSDEEIRRQARTWSSGAAAPPEQLERAARPTELIRSISTKAIAETRNPSHFIWTSIHVPRGPSFHLPQRLPHCQLTTANFQLRRSRHPWISGDFREITCHPERRSPRRQRELRDVSRQSSEKPQPLLTTPSQPTPLTSDDCQLTTPAQPAPPATLHPREAAQTDV